MVGASCLYTQAAAVATAKRKKAARLAEVKVLSSLKHPYIVAYKDSFIEDGFLNIVMESLLAQGLLPLMSRKFIDVREP